MSDDKIRVLKDIKEIRALNDPYRQKILTRMTLIGRPATSKEIAVAMKEAPSKVNYHLKVLEKYKFVEIDHTANINGIIAKYYDIMHTRYDWGEDEKRSEDKDIAFINMIESIYNNAKNHYMNKIKASMSSDEDSSNKAMISSEMYYLNEDEIKEVNDLINKFKKNQKEDRELYSLFVSMIKEDE